MLAVRSAALALVVLSASICTVSGRPSDSDRRKLEVDVAERTGRRLGPFGDLGGYEPTTKVTDLAFLDLDQRSLEAQLRIGTDESLAKAKEIYLHGGHAGSYAILKLDIPLEGSVEEGTPVLGLVNAAGKSAEGRVAGFYFGKEKAVRVSYPVPRDPAEVDGEFVCRVGALKEVGEEVTAGCFESSGTIFINGEKYSYTYDVLGDTLNHVSLASLGDNTMKEMDYPMDHQDFVRYYNYYQEANFGHHWVLAAVKGTKVDYPGRGDADFSQMSSEGRTKAVKMGSAYMNTYMYVLRLMELSVKRCKLACSDECTADDKDCVLCDDRANRAWDEAVALYTGSLEGKGESGNGQFLFSLADELCADFNTCGSQGVSKVNTLIMQHFNTGQMLIEARSCDRAEAHAQQIWKMLAVPLIQGVLQSAYNMDRATRQEGADAPEAEKHNAQGATFAAMVLPRVHACHRDDAELLYGNMRIDALYTDFAIMKSIMEANYECLGISCTDVGGLFHTGTGVYLEGASPCSDVSGASQPTRETATKRSDSAVLFWAFATVVATLICTICTCCMFERFAGEGKEDIDEASIALQHVEDEGEFSEESAGEFI